MPIYYAPDPQSRRVLIRLEKSRNVNLISASLFFLLHTAFAILAFCIAIAGGYWLSMPAEGMALTASNLVELPMAIAVINSGVFLVVWSWGVIKVGLWLRAWVDRFCRSLRLVTHSRSR